MVQLLLVTLQYGNSNINGGLTTDGLTVDGNANIGADGTTTLGYTHVESGLPVI